MHPLRLIEEITPGTYALLLDAGTTLVDELVTQLGHEPNGYFWEGVAEVLVRTQAPHLDGRFDYDSEGGMFCAHGTDQAALRELAAQMATVVSDPDRMRQLIATAQTIGVEFDD